MVRDKEQTMYPPFFGPYFTEEYQRTRRLVAVFTDEDLAYRPTPESMSTGEQSAHLIGGRQFIAGLIRDLSADLGLFRGPELQ